MGARSSGAALPTSTPADLVPVQVTGELAGVRRLQRILERVNDPKVISGALRRGARELKRQMRIHVSGPRPERLGIVTGELHSSFEIETRDLPDRISVGTELVWAEGHEIGRGTRERPFAAPALEIALAKMPGFFIDELKSARDSVPDE